MSITRAQYERFGQVIYEFAKFGVIGATGVFVTNAVYDLLFLHLGVGRSPRLRSPPSSR